MSVKSQNLYSERLTRCLGTMQQLTPKRSEPANTPSPLVLKILLITRQPVRYFIPVCPSPLHVHLCAHTSFSERPCLRFPPAGPLCVAQPPSLPVCATADSSRRLHLLSDTLRRQRPLPGLHGPDHVHREGRDSFFLSEESEPPAGGRPPATSGDHQSAELNLFFSVRRTFCVCVNNLFFIIVSE